MSSTRGGRGAMTKTPITRQDLRRRLYVKAKAEPSWRFWGLYGHVCKRDTLRAAYKLAKENDGAPGGDGVTFEAIEADGVEAFLDQLREELVQRRYRPQRPRKVGIPKEGGKVRHLSIPSIRDRVVQGALKLILDQHLPRLHEDLRTDRYQPLPVRRVEIPKAGKPGEWRPLGIPAVIDRVCQQALLNRLEPIFEPLFDDSSFGYRPGRSAKDALRKIWQEIEAGAEWIVDADLKDYFGSIDHDKLLTLVAQRVADGRVLTLIERMLTAGAMQHGRLFPTTQGTPQGGVVSPLLSNILLTPFDREMRRRGYQLTRYADDWAVTCRSRSEAEAALRCAAKILATLGVQLNVRKTRIVHVRQGIAFLGYTIRRGRRQLHLPATRIKSNARRGGLYAYP